MLKNERRENRKLRRERRKNRKKIRMIGLTIFSTKRRAIFAAFIRSMIRNETAWVMKEADGYMVITPASLLKINFFNKHLGGKKVRVRDLNSRNVYRSVP